MHKPEVYEVFVKCIHLVLFTRTHTHTRSKSVPIKLDGGWPESEKGDCQAVARKEIVKIELSKSHDFFIQSVIE